MLSFILVIFFVASSSGFQIFPNYEEAKWELVNEQPEVSTGILIITYFEITIIQGVQKVVHYLYRFI